jgi:hypothetical protein
MGSGNFENPISKSSIDGKFAVAFHSIIKRREQSVSQLDK